MTKRRFKLVELVRINRSELTHSLNFTVLVYGLAVLLVEVIWPNLNPWFRFFRFYFLTVVAGYFIQRTVAKLPQSPHSASADSPGSSSS